MIGPLILVFILLLIVLVIAGYFNDKAAFWREQAIWWRDQSLRLNRELQDRNLVEHDGEEQLDRN